MCEVGPSRRVAGVGGMRMAGAEDEDPVWQLNLELGSVARGVTDPDGLLLVVKARAALGRPRHGARRFTHL